MSSDVELVKNTDGTPKKNYRGEYIFTRNGMYFCLSLKEFETMMQIMRDEAFRVLDVMTKDENETS